MKKRSAMDARSLKMKISLCDVARCGKVSFVYSVSMSTRVYEVHFVLLKCLTLRLKSARKLKIHMDDYLPCTCFVIQ